MLPTTGVLDKPNPEALLVAWLFRLFLILPTATDNDGSKGSAAISYTYFEEYGPTIRGKRYEMELKLT